MTERLGAVKDLTLYYPFKDNSWWYVGELKSQVKAKSKRVFVDDGRTKLVDNYIKMMNADLQILIELTATASSMWSSSACN